MKNGEDAHIIDSATDFSDISWFYRKKSIDISNITSKKLATSQNSQENATFDENEFSFHVHRKSNICAIIVSTKDYPGFVEFEILKKIMNEYDNCCGNFPNEKCETIQRGIIEYQDPAKAVDDYQDRLELYEILRKMERSLLQFPAGQDRTLQEMLEKCDNISKQLSIFNKCILI